MRSLHPEIQYATLSQQGETAQLGMWVFIATETLFFGALIFTYFIYRNALTAGLLGLLFVGAAALARSAGRAPRIGKRS